MRIKQLKDEDFVNYKNPAMFIGTCFCDWKCCTENKLSTTVCQNSQLAQSKTVYMPVDEIFHRYINNNITKSIVIGGLEPFKQYDELLELIKYFRDHNCYDDFVIYTGYYDYELQKEILELKQYSNIVIKFGRYIPNHNKHYDNILGIYLASDNQYAEKIS